MIAVFSLSTLQELSHKNLLCFHLTCKANYFKAHIVSPPPQQLYLLHSVSTGSHNANQVQFPCLTFSRGQKRLCFPPPLGRKYKSHKILEQKAHKYCEGQVVHLTLLAVIVCIEKTLLADKSSDILFQTATYIDH